jgi:hypothetical protein
LLTEMIDAAEQAHRLTADVTVSQPEADRQRRDALLWNFTVLGEAAHTGRQKRLDKAGVVAVELIVRPDDLEPYRGRRREYRGERLQLEVADGSPGATDFIGPAGLRPADAWGRCLDG